MPPILRLPSQSTAASSRRPRRNGPPWVRRCNAAIDIKRRNELGSKIRSVGPCSWRTFGCETIAESSKIVLMWIKGLQSLDQTPIRPHQVIARADGNRQSGHPLEIKTACSQCNQRELCLPFGLDPNEVDQLDDSSAAAARSSGSSISTARASLRGDLRDPRRLLQDRRDPRGRPRPGHRLPDDRRRCWASTASAPNTTLQRAIALEDSEVCVIPSGRLEELSREVRACSTSSTRSRAARSCATTA